MRGEIPLLEISPITQESDTPTCGLSIVQIVGSKLGKVVIQVA